MWELHGSGIELVSPALAGGFFTTDPPWKPLNEFLKAKCELASVEQLELQHRGFCTYSPAISMDPYQVLMRKIGAVLRRPEGVPLSGTGMQEIICFCCGACTWGVSCLPALSSCGKQELYTTAGKGSTPFHPQGPGENLLVWRRA